MPTSAVAKGKPLFGKTGAFKATNVGATVTVRVTDEGVDPFRVMLGALNAQLMPAGSDGQVKRIVSLSPPSGVAVTVN
jgi:hypothetical protein